ncbi:hypothetical protein TNCV_2188031 [Trichonephila clavipes]|nr:hypothetical protein TNCV_2188031 [Trichonephila clavipes]
MLAVERVSANCAPHCGVINCADECGVNICLGIKSLLWNFPPSTLFTSAMSVLCSVEISVSRRFSTAPVHHLDSAIHDRRILAYRIGCDHFSQSAICIVSFTRRVVPKRRRWVNKGIYNN